MMTHKKGVSTTTSNYDTIKKNRDDIKIIIISSHSHKQLKNYETNKNYFMPS